MTSGGFLWFRVMAGRQIFFLKQRLFHTLSSLLADNRVCGRLRSQLLRWNGATMGRGCVIRGGITVHESFHITMGEACFLNYGCLLDASEPIVIGSRVQFGFNVSLLTGDHQIGPPACRTGDCSPRPIRIDDGCWVGANATILSGVTLGKGSVIAAGAVVSADVPAHKLAAGNPARVIKSLAVEPEATAAEDPAGAASGQPLRPAA